MGLTPFSRADGIEYFRRFCPYGAPGDRLALREAFALVPVSAYRGSEGVAQTTNPDAETYEAAIYRAGFDRSRGGIVWRSPATMPLWAVRWHPVITAVRLERVQDMSEADAWACGFDGNCPVGYIPSHQSGPCVYHYAVQFDRDNPRTPWDSNQWVWVIDVEMVKV